MGIVGPWWSVQKADLLIKSSLRPPKNRLLRSCRKMSRSKASEIPRSEAYKEVRRSDEG